jgi:hypothetical protein
MGKLVREALQGRWRQLRRKLRLVIEDDQVESTQIPWIVQR